MTIIDEIDAVCPARGADAGLHGSRVVAQLLTLMATTAKEDRRRTRIVGRDAERGRTAGSNASTRDVAVDAFDPPWWRRRIDQTRWTRFSSTGKIRRRD